MNTIDRIHELLRECKIPVARLEKDCGFSNGYIRALRDGKLPADRLFKVADYLSVSPRWLATGETSTPYYPYKIASSFEEPLPITPYEQRLQDLIEVFRDMSDEGQRKVVAYAMDLFSTDKYKKFSEEQEQA